jgi:hypothetical protein
VDGVAYYRMEILVAPVALDHHTRGDTNVVLGYLAKMDHLHRFALCGAQLLLDG